MTHEEVAVEFDALVERHPQYAKYRKLMVPGVMMKTWRKNFFTYLRKGDPVFMLARPDGTLSVFGIYPNRFPDHFPGEFQSDIFVCRDKTWAKEV